MTSPSSSQKVLINVVSGRAGSGHYSTYEALRSVAEQQQLPWQFSVTDIDEIVNRLSDQKKVVNAYKLLGISADELYNWMLKKGWTWLHPLMLRLNKVLLKLNYAAGIKIFTQYWQEQQPDLVVSIVPMYNRGLWDSLQQGKPGTPVVTIMTDLADSPPGFWGEPETGYLVCPTPKAVEQAREMGVAQEKIISTSGIVVHPRFYEPSRGDRAAERQKLGLDPDCLTGIVLFGGYGSSVMLKIAELLDGEKLQLIFICGRNEELAEALRSKGCQKRFVTGFTRDIPYYMSLADFFVGKPGSVSLSEALVMKLPVIVERNWTTLMQERYNTDWVQQQEVGLVVRSFRQIDGAVEQFLEPENFARYRTNVEKLNNRAVFEIPKILHQILVTNNS